jgi:thiamine kinase-like enzyme
MVQRGGKAIASGTYGCVFRPALKCKNDYTRYSGVSKLMKKDDANKEFKEINIYKNILSNIPNYEKYFILATNICYVNELNDNDKEDIDQKCNNWDFYESFKNSSMNDFLSINLSDGGYSVEYYILNNYTNKITFDKLNRSIQKLIYNAIIPMNELKLLHCDLKSDNILIDSNGNLKIIDFGIALLYDKGFQNVYSEIEWRPIQINAPLSNIVFSEFYLQKINEYLKSASISRSKITKIDIKNIIKSSFNEYTSTYGPGHLSILTKLLETVNKYTSFKQINYLNLISSYISISIYPYIKYNKSQNNYEIYFDVKDYFYKFYSKNVDLIGIVCLYLPLFDLIDNYSNRLKLAYNVNSDDFKKQLCDFFYKYLFLSHSTILKPEVIFNDLNILSTYLYRPGIFNNETNKPIINKQIKSIYHVKSNTIKPDNETIKQRVKSINEIYNFKNKINKSKRKKINRKKTRKIKNK